MDWQCALTWIESHPGFASWLQAFGSIVAIGVAIRLSGSERRYQAKVSRLARVDAIERSIQAAEFSLKVSKNTFEFFSCNSIARSMIPRYLRVIDQASSYVDEARLDQSIDSQVSSAVIEVKNALVDIRSLTSAWADNEDDDYSHEIDYFQANIGRIRLAAESLIKMKLESQMRLRWWWPTWLT